MAKSGGRSFQVQIYGRVQGVGFRYSTRNLAKKMGINGWVRNSPDGSVEVYCEGDSAKLEKFLRWLAKGPIGSHVSRIQRREMPQSAKYRDFSINF